MENANSNMTEPDFNQALDAHVDPSTFNLSGIIHPALHLALALALLLLRLLACYREQTCFLTWLVITAAPGTYPVSPATLGVPAGGAKPKAELLKLITCPFLELSVETIQGAQSNFEQD